MRRISWVFGVIAMILCMAPATRLIAQDVHRRVDVNWVPVPFVVAGAVAVVVVARWLRQKASVRYLHRSIERGQAGASPAFVFTLLAWVPAGAAFGYAAGSWFVANQVEDPSPKTYLKGLAGYPLPILFLFAGIAVLAAAGYYAWSYRRRHELPVLRQAGIAIVVEPEPPKPVKVTKLWLQGTLIDGSLYAGAIVPRLFSDDDKPTSDELAQGVFGVLAGPAVISFVLLALLLLYWPTRRSAVDALRQPSSIAAIGITLAGYAIAQAGPEIAGNILGLIGVLIGSATCLNIMTRGAQPWMGLFYLAGNYIYGYLSAPDGNAALPEGVTGWIVAILAAAYAIREARGHWHEWTDLVRPQTG